MGAVSLPTRSEFSEKVYVELANPVNLSAVSVLEQDLTPALIPVTSSFNMCGVKR